MVRSAFAQSQHGIFCMLLAVLFFSTMDMVAKTLTESLHTFQVIWARYAFQTILVTLVFLPRLATLLRTGHIYLQLIRSAFLFLATISFFFGFAEVGLAEATVIFMVNPLFIAIGAYFFLGEPIGPRRVIAVLAGLAGTMIVIRPGFESFSAYALLPLCASGFFAGYAISTRFLGRDEPVWTSFLYTTIIGALIATPAVPMFWTTPGWTELSLMVLLGCLGSFGHYLLVRALFVAEAGLLAPFGYLGIVFAIMYSMLVFGHYPDLYTYLGALVIVLSGVYAWYRERAVALETQENA